MPPDRQSCLHPGEVDDRGESYCGRLDTECCAKARARAFKSVEAIVSGWGDGREAPDA